MDRNHAGDDFGRGQAKDLPACPALDAREKAVRNSVASETGALASEVIEKTWGRSHVDDQVGRVDWLDFWVAGEEALDPAEKDRPGTAAAVALVEAVTCSRVTEFSAVAKPVSAVVVKVVVVVAELEAPEA